MLESLSAPELFVMLIGSILIPLGIGAAIGFIILFLRSGKDKHCRSAKAYLAGFGEGLERCLDSKKPVQKLCAAAVEQLQRAAPQTRQKAYLDAADILEGAAQKASFSRDKAAVLYFQGWLLEDIGLNHRAADCLRASLELDQTNAYAWNALGTLLRSSQQKALYDEAAACYLQAIELGYLGWPEANLGILYMMKGDLGSARPWLERAAQRKDSLDIAMASMAVLEARSGNASLAESYYGRAVQAGYPNLDDLRRQINTFLTAAGPSQPTSRPAKKTNDKQSKW